MRVVSYDKACSAREGSTPACLQTGSNTALMLRLCKANTRRASSITYYLPKEHGGGTYDDGTWHDDPANLEIRSHGKEACPMTDKEIQQAVLRELEWEPQV